ncbi:MAG TPA: hypothetical protein VF398_04125 [bacterium]|jgi:hypothetical protein
MRITARIIAVLWFGFWAFFGIASGIGEGGSNIIFHLIFPTLIFAVVLFVVWRWERIGSLILIVMGLVVAIGYPLTMGRRFPVSTSIFMELIMALPPLLAGLLLMMARRNKTPAAVA